jgi:hypothetical protein
VKIGKRIKVKGKRQKAGRLGSLEALKRNLDYICHLPSHPHNFSAS